MTLLSRWLALPAVLSMLALASGPAVSQAGGGWTGEFTVRVESAGKKPVASGPAKANVNGTFEWSTTHEVRGTLTYGQKLRGAVAKNQPERDNEQRYESWLARVPGGRQPARLTLSSLRSEVSSGKVVAVDGEGAAAINRANAGKIGRVEHVRSRTEVKVDGDDGARMGGAYLQIDRVANQIRFESPTIEINPARATVTEQFVSRLDKAAAPGEWDRNDTFTPRDTRELRLAGQLPHPVEFVFDVPAQTLAESREITLTQNFKAGFVDYEVEPSRGTITLVLRRADAAAAAAAPAATAPATAAAAGGAAAVGAAAAVGGAAAAGARPAPTTTAGAPAANPCPPPARTASNANEGQRTGAQVGAEVGGAVLGGGWGRNVGGAVGGVLGALGGAAKKPEPQQAPAADCPR